MQAPEYSLVLSNGIGAWYSTTISASRLSKNVLNLEEGFIFTIKHNLSRSPISHIYFTLSKGEGRGPVLNLCGSSENRSLSLNFFKTFKQSPFQLLLFSTFSLAKRNKVNFFTSDKGMNDFGKSHKMQLKRRLFRHVKENGVYKSHIHELGVFPKLSLTELERILAESKPVPVRLLPPTSPLRPVRVNSYAQLILKRIGKNKYKSFTKARRAKMVQK